MLPQRPPRHAPIGAIGNGLMLLVLDGVPRVAPGATNRRIEAADVLWLLIGAIPIGPEI
jgi:hypothetical protein